MSGFAAPVSSFGDLSREQQGFVMASVPIANDGGALDVLGRRFVSRFEMFIPRAALANIVATAHRRKKRQEKNGGVQAKNSKKPRFCRNTRQEKYQ